MTINNFFSGAAGTTLQDQWRNFCFSQGALGTVTQDLWIQFIQSWALAHSVTITGTLDDQTRRFLILYLGLSDTGQSVEDLWGLVTGPYSGASIFPTIPDENSTFNDEGTSTTGWTGSNATLLVTGSTLRQTKVAGGSNSSMTKTITFTPTSRDYLLYGSIRGRNNADTVSVIWMLNGSKEVSVWLGSNGTSVATPGMVTLVGTTGASTRNSATAMTGFDYENNSVEFCLHFDSKYNTLTMYTRDVGGGYTYRARVACDWFDSTSVQLLTTTASLAGAWVEFDYVTLARPNILAIGDSICEGKTLFSPNPALGLTDYTSTWMKYCKIYQGLRNNLIIDKGVGGNTSAQILARITDATGEGGRVIFLHASTNDVVGGISQVDRTTNIQSSVNAITASSASAVLLNAMYGTSTAPDNTPSPALRDYMTTWWDTSSSTITGLAGRINIMSPVAGGGGFMASSLTQSDGLHPTPSGYSAIGAFIGAQ